MNSDRISINKIKSISLSLDSKSRNWSKNNQYYLGNDGQQDFICLLNSPTNSLQFYNLKGEKLNEIKFNTEGPQGTGIISGFLYINQDSIVILNYQKNQLFLSNTKGKIIKTYSLYSTVQSDYALRAWSEDGSEIFLKKNHLFLPAIPFLNYRKNPKEYYNKGLLGIDLDLTTSSVRFQIPYPNKEQLIDKPHTTQSIYPKCISNPASGSLIYSFGIDPYVYEYTTDGVLVKKHFLGTKNTDEKAKPMENRKELEDPIEEALNYTNNLCYERLFFDKFANLYYRIVKHSIPSSNEYTRKDFNMGKKPWFTYSLIIADNNFNILDEITLNKDIGSGAFIITKDGVLIQRENDDENHMVFDLYKIAKK